MKRLLLAFTLLLSLSAPASATYGLAQAVPTRGQVGSSSTTVSSTFASPPTSGNLMVAFLLYAEAGGASSAGTVAVKDGNNVAFTVTPNSPSNARPGSAGLIYIFSLQVPATPNSVITATWTTSTGVGGLASLWVIEFVPTSGTNGGIDSDGAGTGTTGTALGTPTATVSQANDLVVSAALSDHQVSTVNSPWVTVAAGTGTNQFSEGIGYILARGTNVAVDMTQNTSSGWDSMVASFKFTPTGGGGCTPTGTLLGVEKCH